MKATVKNGKASYINFNNSFIDLNKETDLSFSNAMRLSRVADVEVQYDFVEYNPELFRQERFFNFMGDIDLQSGFGNCSYNLLKYSSEYQIAHLGRMVGVRDPYISTCKERELQQDGAMIWHDQPRGDWEVSPFQRNIAIVPWETTRIPKSWVAKLNCFDALLVPCAENVNSFRNSGVKIPIEVIHWGVDGEKFYPLERQSHLKFTFGHLGMLSERKGTDVLVKAFLAAFPTEQDVQLICKTSAFGFPFAVHDKRIKTLISLVDHDDLLRIYSQFDCFVFPTRGEGFGLTPLEAMATGIPAIVTNWGGPVEYMTPEVGWALDYSMTPALPFTEHTYKEDCGDWTEPNFDHLVQLLRYAYEHRDEVKQKGENAAKYVKENWLWQQQIHLYHEALEKHL